jgi:tetratricopeptide (TPR) repeat protein
MKLCDNKCHFILVSGYFFFFLILLLVACNPSPQTTSSLIQLPEINGEAVSFLGDTLQRPMEDEITFHQKDSLLQESYAMYLADSTDLDNIIWYGRRLAYMHRYKDAMDIFTGGLRYFPNAPELYRHRGHRFITLRRLEDAIADLEHGIQLAQHRKMEIEADGIPNKLNIPLSNLHFNLYYHLGLAYFLKADYPKAIETYLSCMKYSDNPDLKVATTDWLYLSYLRAGDKSSAAKWLTDINAHMEIIENDGYLERLLIYKGERKPVAIKDPTIDPVAFATQNYGISCWYEMNDQTAEAASIRRLILSSSIWPAFGYIAAEADSSRLTAH